jgi:hypothetical protein
VATHDVTFMVPERSLGKADLVFRVKGDGEMVGRLKVSHGAIVWMPKNGKAGYRIGWAGFDRIMQQAGCKQRL